MIRFNLIVKMALFSLITLPGASRAVEIPRQPSREQAVRVNELTASSTTRGELTNWLESAPDRCISSSSSVEVCEWQLGDRDERWEDLAEAIDTNRRVALICALPTDGSARLKSSCAARPRQSNKRDFNATRFQRKEGVKLEDVRVAYQKLAQRWIDEALTMASLSFLLGGVPDRCDAGQEETRTCVWILDDRDFGHGTVVTALGARTVDRVRLECELPDDGRPRPVDSCQAAVDDENATRE